jgi:nitric oxide reductase activation protein
VLSSNTQPMSSNMHACIGQGQGPTTLLRSHASIRDRHRELRAFEGSSSSIVASDIASVQPGRYSRIGLAWWKAI